MKAWTSARILMTTDAVGGVWSYSTALATALAKRGHEVLLVTLGPPPQRDQFVIGVNETLNRTTAAGLTEAFTRALTA